jgi:hypothetical protein
MKPGKNRDRYFTSEDIMEQANAAMDILTEHYPEYKHIFVYNNAPSHLKRPEGSVTARNMPKYTPKPGTNWEIEVSKHDVNGNLEYNTDGSIKKHKIPMQDSVLTDGQFSLCTFLKATNMLVCSKVWW